MDTDEAWQRWGEREPYYGVMTDPRFLSANLDEARKAEFFATGERYVGQLQATLQTLFGDVRPRHVVDFGCGTGRILLPLAAAYPEVRGIDVSAAMRRECERNIAAAGAGNASVCSTQAYLAGAERCDLLHSSLVFQHIRPVQGFSVLAQLLERLGDGGLLAVQFCTDTGQSAARLLASRVKNTVPGLPALVSWLRNRQVLPAPMEMHAYDREQLESAFARHAVHIAHVRDYAEAGITISTYFGRKAVS
jgi:trans-aconitate methyltransferase